MCCYKEIASSKEEYGIRISSPWYGPGTLVCWDCSLVPEKFVLPKEGWSHIRRAQDSRGIEYNEHVGCFCCAGDDFLTMARHVVEHIESGEDIHPAVLRFLEYEYYYRRVYMEHSIDSYLCDRLARKLWPDTESYYKELGYKALCREARESLGERYTKYERFPEDPRTRVTERGEECLEEAK